MINRHFDISEEIRLVPTYNQTLRITMEIEAQIEHQRHWFRFIEKPAATANYTVALTTTGPGQLSAGYVLRNGLLTLRPSDTRPRSSFMGADYLMAEDESIALHILLQRALITMRPTEWHDAHLLATLRDWTCWRIPRHAYDADKCYHGLRCLNLESEHKFEILKSPQQTTERVMVPHYRSARV